MYNKDCIFHASALLLASGDASHNSGPVRGDESGPTVVGGRMDIINFSLLCSRVPLSVCPALGMNDPLCFARNINIGNWLMFQPGKRDDHSQCAPRLCLHTTATVAVDVAAIVMTLVMIYHIKSKYTAVGMLMRIATRQTKHARCRPEGNGPLLLLLSAGCHPRDAPRLQHYSLFITRLQGRPDCTRVRVPHVRHVHHVF